MSCSELVHVLLLVHRLFILFSLLIYDLFKISSLLVHSLLTFYPQFVNAMITIFITYYSWLLYDYTMQYGPNWGFMWSYCFLLSKPQSNLNTRLGLTIKWLCTPTHHRNSMSAITQLLLTRFGPNFKYRFLGSTTK